MSRDSKVPTPALERLATYLRYLNDLGDQGAETISSRDIEEATGIHAAQFRKDLSYFGGFGSRGIGYNTQELKRHIARILKVDSGQSVLLVGAGNLGAALVGYTGLPQHNFNIVGAFDNNPEKIGKTIWELTIRDMDDLDEVNRALGAEIAILTVPAEAAQRVTDQLVQAGIRVILNFAPTVIRAPENVVVRNVCFIQELTVLSYHLSPEAPSD